MEYVGIEIVGDEAWNPKASSYEALMKKIKGTGADAIFLGGLISENGGQVIKDKVAVLGPNDGAVKLFARTGSSRRRRSTSPEGRRQAGSSPTQVLPVDKITGAAAAGVQRPAEGRRTQGRTAPGVRGVRRTGRRGACSTRSLRPTARARASSRHMFATEVTDGHHRIVLVQRERRSQDAAGAVVAFTMYKATTEVMESVFTDSPSPESGQAAQGSCTSDRTKWRGPLRRRHPVFRVTSMSSTAIAALLTACGRSACSTSSGCCSSRALLVWLLVKFFEDPTRFLDVTVIGVTVGATYGLIALGYTLVYGILQLINFAHGDVFALSGLAAFSIITWLGLDAEARPSRWSSAASCSCSSSPCRGSHWRTPSSSASRTSRCATRPRLAPLITAVGVSFILQNVGLAIYGPSFHTIPDVVPRTDAISIGGVAVQWNDLAVFAVVVPLLVVLTWFVRTTRQGKSMRAVAQDADAASMLGIDVNRTISLTFMLAGALAAAAGLIYLLQFNMRYDTGFELGLIAFTAAVLGGIGNLPGRGARRDADRPRPGLQRGPRRYSGR